MQVTAAEVEELSQMRENIRRSVDALELCWSCQRVAECEPATVDDGPPVWLCNACATSLNSHTMDSKTELVWPLGF
jgi:hypothetical protein